MKQKKFEGSERQLRGALLRELLSKPQTEKELVKKFPHAKEKVPRLLARLADEGLLKKRGSRYEAAD